MDRSLDSTSANSATANSTTSSAAAPSRRGLPMLSLFAANAISLTGSVLTVVAVPWFVLVTTGSATKTGLTAAAELLAAVVAAFFGGALVDRVGATRMSVLADVMSGLAVAAIPALYYTVGLKFPYLLALVFLATFFNQPGGTARAVLTPDLASLAHMRLERANSWLQSIQRGSRLLGAPVAGLLIALFEPGRVLWIDAATFGVSAVLIGLAVPRISVAATGPAVEPAHGQKRGNYLADILVGVRYIRRDRLALTLVLTTMVTNFLDAPVFAVLLPVYARERFGHALDLGLIIAAIGAGALASSLLFGLIGHWLPRRATFVTSFILVGLPYAVLALQPSLEITLAAAAFSGLAAGPLNPILGTVAQERVPAELRGRVFGANTAVALMAMPVGVLLGGYLTDMFGVQPMFLGIAACYLAVTLSLLFNPVLRQMNAPVPAAPTIPAARSASLSPKAGAPRPSLSDQSPTRRNTPPLSL